MTSSDTFRVRLRVRIAKGFTTEATKLNVKVADREVAIYSQNKDEHLSAARWIILEARGFTSEEAAHQFGNNLRWMLQMAALSSRLGVDVGDDKSATWINEDFARSMGLLKEHERIAPNIHGLAILPDDDNTRFPIFNAQATVTADPEHFTSALRELGESDGTDTGAAVNGLRLLNLALMTSEPLAQMVLAFSAVEELGQNERWSEAQVVLIETLAAAAEASAEGTADERGEVAQAIRKGLFPLSLRQGVLRLLSRLDLDHLRKQWDRLYGIRSGVFHGTAHLSNSEISQAASDTIALCGWVVLAVAANKGARVPSIAETHFNTGAAAPAQEDSARKRRSDQHRPQND